MKVGTRDYRDQAQRQPTGRASNFSNASSNVQRALMYTSWGQREINFSQGVYCTPTCSDNHVVVGTKSCSLYKTKTRGKQRFPVSASAVNFPLVEPFDDYRNW
jgi:hypothetical protein